MNGVQCGDTDDIQRGHFELVCAVGTIHKGYVNRRINNVKGVGMC